MPKCFYCGKHYENPRGLSLVMNDTSVRHLCSSKCRRNMKMKRRNVRWIKKQKLTKEDILAENVEEVLESAPVEEAPKEKSKGEAPKEDKK